MNKFRFLFPAVAFAIAITGAIASFASEKDALIVGDKFLSSGTCTTCFTASADICQTTSTNRVCQCTDVSGPGGTLVQAYRNSTCDVLYRPN